MRTDEQIGTALENPDDVRPLLMSASTRELAHLREAVAVGENADVNNLAEALDAMIVKELGGGNGGLLFKLSAWAARNLGIEDEPADLAAADREILRETRHAAKYETETNGAGRGALFVAAVELARLRQKKLKRLRGWRPLLNLLVGRRTSPRPAPHDLDLQTNAQPAVLPPAADEPDEALWETIRKAGGTVPLAIWEEKLAQARKDLGRFNIIVAGRTGVGKTTLIGAIFGKDIGDTLMGRPRTRGRIWYPETPGDADILRLCDTEGLELERYEETLDGLRQEILSRNRSADPFDHIHVAWLCIDEPSLTVQPGEEALTRLLTDEGIPVIAALTKAGMAPSFRDEVWRILPDLREVIRVRASAIEFEGQRFAPTGLTELMDATQKAVPRAVEAAWQVASRNLDANVKRSETIIRRAAAAAGAAGAAPVPLADAAGVFGVQTGMIISISLNMGMKLRRSDLRAMAITMIGALGLTAGGRFIAGQVAKMIPGVGTIAGAALTGSAAAALTYGLGRAYLQYLRSFFVRNQRMPDAEEVINGFQDYWRKWKNKYEAPPESANS